MKATAKDINTFSVKTIIFRKENSLNIFNISTRGVKLFPVPFEDIFCGLRGVPMFLLPLGWYCGIFLSIRVFSILLKCYTRYCYMFSFNSNTFTSLQISQFSILSSFVQPFTFLKNHISAACILLRVRFVPKLLPKIVTQNLLAYIIDIFVLDFFLFCFSWFYISCHIFFGSY